MYSVVLMAALTTSGEVATWGRYDYWGGGCYGCYGCWGGYWGGWYGRYGYWGGYSGWVPYGYAYAPAYAGPVILTTSVTRIDAPTLESGLPDSVQLVVDLPADALLFVNDKATNSTTARRVFSSPPLEPGSTYSYLLRAELQREGKTYQQTKKVLVRAGQETTTSFTESGIMQAARADR